MTTSRAINWNHRWFGYWGGKSQSQGEFPSIEDFTDGTWRPKGKRKLLAYLERAPVIITWAPSANCLVCGCDLGNGSKNHSDGVWVWPAGLAHYVRKHNVVLPAAFAEHIRSHKCRLPSEEEVRWESLDWPGRQADGKPPEEADPC